jgi:phenylacetate-CoA ligase
MSRFLHRHILLPAFETGWKRRKTFRHWADLDRTQWLSRSELEGIQFKALNGLIAHAFESCPYYREAWSALGLHPRQLKSPEDITRWPRIDRDTILLNRSAMRAARPPMPLIVKTTGGSTGLPLQFDLDHGSNDRRTAAAHRAYAWAGAAPGAKQLYLWGAPLGARSFRARIKDTLYHRMHRRRIVSCFDMDESLPSRFLSALASVSPDVVVAYTTPLDEVARRLEETRIAPPFRPKSIVLGAEKVHPFQRERIERVFQAPVFETYGSREFMLIGAECPRHRGLHVTAEQLLVEVLDDDGRPTPDGHEGNVVITDLYNYGMPFIRYSNGDRAVAGWDACDCGRGLPLLRKVVGRRLDMLHLPGGRSVPGELFVYLVKDFPAVRRYQVIQEEPSRIRFALIDGGLSLPDRARLERLVRDAVGPEVRVDFHPVEQIPLTAAGKLRVVVNLVGREKVA